jgi:hypothetical protein
MRLTSTQSDRLRAVLRRLKEEKFDGNETALAKAINVGQTTVFRFLSGKHGATMETAEKIAAYLGVGVAGLLGLDSKPPTQPAQIVSPAPPPVSETRLVEDAVNDLLNEAFNHDRHEPSDVLLVGEALRLQAPLLKSHVEPLDIVRALLDTAADARLKGKRLKAEELPVVALGTTKRQLVSAEERIAQLMAQGDREAARLGVETRNTPHPLLVQQVDRMMGKKPSNKGTKSGKGGSKGARGA